MWEASGGLLQVHALTDLLIYHLIPRNPSSFFSFLHLTALLPLQSLRGSPNCVARSPPPVGQLVLATGGERSATDVSLSLVTAARLFIFSILPFQKAFCVAETLSLRISQSSDPLMTLLSLKMFPLLRRVVRSTTLLRSGNIFNSM